MKTIRLAILFSGNGSNLENIYRKMQGMVVNSSLGAPCGDFGNLGRFADAPVQSHAPNSQKTSQLPPQILEFGDLKNAESTLDSENYVKIKLNFVLAISSKAEAYGITRCANLGLKCEVVDYKQNKENFIPKIIALLENNQIDLVILAGFMKILPPAFNAKFRAINIHPSILPLFKGANAIAESYQSDMKIAGVSVHFVSDELDSGALIMQDIIHKIEGESLENFEARIHELEYEIYPKAIIKAIQTLCNSPHKNSSLGAPFALGENFGEQQTPSLVLSPKFSPNTKLPPQILELDSKTNSAESSENLQNLEQKNTESSPDSAQNITIFKQGERIKFGEALFKLN